MREADASSTALLTARRKADDLFSADVPQWNYRVERNNCEFSNKIPSNKSAFIEKLQLTSIHSFRVNETMRLTMSQASSVSSRQLQKNKRSPKF